MYNLKRKPTANTYCGKKVSQKQAHSHVTDSPSLHRDSRLKVILVARPLFMQAIQV
jgi:hypothetical protein